MTSTATQSQATLPIERIGLKITAQRSGTHVTGRAEFPYQTHGRHHVDIDYRSIRIDDEKTNQRLEAVLRYHDLVQRNGSPKLVIAKRVGSGVGVSARSIQVWAKSYADHGIDGLRDSYIKPKRGVLQLTESDATLAVQIAVWWSFRIGNLSVVDNQVMKIASTLATRQNLADVLAAIDCYYSYDTQRSKYPFKPLDRWAKHDFVVWLGRAFDQADYRRGASQDCDIRTPLCVPDTSKTGQQRMPISKYRKREVGDFKVVEGMVDIADGDDRHVSITQHILSSYDGQTVFEVASTMPEEYRVMLIRAAQGNRQSKDQAMATRSIWWEYIPEPIRQRYPASTAATCFINELRTALPVR